DLRGGDGFKNLLVLTDGMDNRFVAGDYPNDPTPLHSDGDPDFNKNSKGNLDEIPKFLREQFDGSGISVNMVLFQVPGPEKTKARKQFEEIAKFSLPGKVYETEDVNDLKTYLKQGTIQRLRWRLEKDGKLVRGAETLDISRIGGSPAWISGLEDGIYTAIVHTFRRDIEIRRGDFLSASLTGAGPTGTRLVRSLLSEEAGVAPNCRAKVRDWQLGVLQNRFGADGAAEMLIGVENEAGRDPAGGTLKQIKPDFCWFEVKPQKI